MKCQHCGSTDIIMIQGQNYCLNCGYAVAPPTSPVAATRAAKPNAIAAKSGPKGKAPKASGGKPASSKSENVTSSPARRQRGQGFGPNAASSSVHPLRFSLLAALIAAGVSGSITALALWLRVDSDTGAYLIVATIIGLGVLISLAHTALLYGRSRSQDGRPATREYWWMAARNGFMDVVNVQLIAIISALVLVGVGLVVWKAGLVLDVHFGRIVSGIFLGAANLVLIWGFLGIYTAARLATPAVVVGGFSAAQAVRVGWRLYEKAGGHLVAAGVEALLGRAIATVILAVVGYAAITGLEASGTAAVAIGSGLGIALIMFCACMLTLEVDTKLWLTQYRHLATLCPPSERIQLLTGRVQSHTIS